MAPLQIGLMLESVQLTDITCIDILGNLSTEYVKASAFLVNNPTLTEQCLKESHEMTIHYIATTLEPGFMTPSLRFLPTVTYDDCPRDLDILIIGGPLLTHRPPQADKFMREAVPRTKTVLTTCIGGLWLASTGLLDGKKATTNRGALEQAKKLYPNVEWLDQRWVVDGKFWTAGGAYAGSDMVATFARETFGKTVVEASLIGMDLEPNARGQFYSK